MYAYKMFFFFGKHLKTVKLSFTRYFPEALLAYFKVSKTFSISCLLALKFLKLSILACFEKFIKLFILACLLCFDLKVYKAFLKSLALKTFKTFPKSLVLKSFQNFL